MRQKPRNPIALVARMRGGAGRHRGPREMPVADVIAEQEAGYVHPRELPCSDDECRWCNDALD